MDQPSQPERPPIVKLVKGQEVSLGLGALILIAIIVAFCSGKTDLSPVTNHLGQMDQMIMRLENKLNQMDEKIQRLEKKLDEISKKQ